MTRFALPLLCAAAALHAGDDRVAQGLNQFGIACYHQLEGGSGNLIFSPFSISSALSMTLAGAHGRTADEIAAVLHQRYPDPGYPAAFMALADDLARRANGGGNELLNANGLWVQSGFRLLPDFQQTVEHTYAAPLTSLDFAKNLESARTAINSWTDQHTKGKIHELFAPGSLDNRTRLVLTSAVYFYGKWERPFSTRNTRPAAFKLGGAGTVQAPFMHQTASFGYAETPTLQILEMRYAGTGLAWDVLLPKSDDGLTNLEKSMTPENLAAWLGSLSNRSVEVAFPKFRAESGFSLRETLAHMGMPSAFGNADFSGIDGRPDLALSDVVHKAFVDVAEEGTEAAAATGSTAVLVRMVTPEHTVFRADHPFLFFIRDTRTRLPLFSGRLMNPGR
jgi:serpin B